MLVVAGSLAAAALQMALLLVAAKLLGISGYATFSVLLSIGVLIAAMTGEWLRMALSRQAGMQQSRLRVQFLGEVRQTARLLSVATVATGALAATMLLLSGHQHFAVSVLAAAISASGALISDITATFLRFTADRRTFTLVALGRVAVSGTSTAVGAALGASPELCVILFGASNGAFALSVQAWKWRTANSLNRRRTLRLFARPGWMMATSSLSMNFASAASRAAIQAALPSPIAGAVILSMDLAIRGLTVLGSALNTWGARRIFDASHNRSKTDENHALKSVAPVFLAAWLSVGAYGILASLVIPTLISSDVDFRSYGAIAAVNIISFHFALGRIYLLDPASASMSRDSEIALASAVSAIALSICLGFIFIGGLRGIGTFAAPIAFAISSGSYLLRNPSYLQATISRPVIYLAVSKIAATLIGTAAIGIGAPSGWLPVLLAIVLITDIYAITALVKANQQNPSLDR